VSKPARYKAFISYSHKDEAWASRLQRRLENFKLPNKGDTRWPLRPVFLDRSELASGPDLSDSVNRALKASDALVVVCSPAAAASKWVNAEILAFKRLGNEAVYPFVIDGEPGSGNPGTECFPDALRFRLGDDGQLSSIPAEPLAADARKQGDGQGAYLKLIAGLLGVSFDSLKLRQQRKHVRQALGIAAGATAMLVVTSFLAVTAYRAQQDAERKRDQAENLISFMLGDLREKLQPVGRLDVLDGVGEQALEYFSSLRESELTSDALLTRATALRQIGEVRVAQGLIDEGMIAFYEARDLLENVATDNESLRLFELGQINFWIADAHFNDLQLEKAQEYIEKYLDISRNLVELEPGNTDFQLELMYAESNLGTLAYRANNMFQAREYFNKALEMGRALLSSQPIDEYEYELADTISWLGAVESSAGNFTEAANWYQQQVAIREKLLTARESPSRKHLLALAQFKYGDALHQTGQDSAAYAAVSKAVQSYRELVSYDPQNYDWQRELAWTLTLLARDGYAAEIMTLSDARSNLLLATEAMSRIDEERTAEIARVFAAIDTERGRIELIEGNARWAADHAADALEHLKSFDSGKDRVRVLPIFAKASYLLSESTLALGNRDKSMSIAESAFRKLAVQEHDPVELYAVAALLAYRAKLPASDEMLSIIAGTDFNARAYIPYTDAEEWWTRRINSSSK
jgi:tetratricopeptide (TPR) repeat protein